MDVGSDVLDGYFEAHGVLAAVVVGDSDGNGVWPIVRIGVNQLDRSLGRHLGGAALAVHRLIVLGHYRTTVTPIDSIRECLLCRTLWLWIARIVEAGVSPVEKEGVQLPLSEGHVIYLRQCRTGVPDYDLEMLRIGVAVVVGDGDLDGVGAIIGVVVHTIEVAFREHTWRAHLDLRHRALVRNCAVAPVDSIGEGLL